MSVLAPQIIEGSNISHVWGRALLAALNAPSHSMAPLLISVAGFTGELPDENAAVRTQTDELLLGHEMNRVRTTALTIFPWEMWTRPNCSEFCSLCVDQLAPRMKARDTRNGYGIYFERMMAYQGVRGANVRVVNQVEFVINLLNGPKKPRRSALQIACFDPSKDHTGQPVRGFPCLQQVSVSHDGGNALAVNAYYPTQYIFDRAYGNYLGLCHLGAFIAHQTKMKFVRLNCFVGHPELGDVPKRDLKGLFALITRQLEASTIAETDQ